MGYGIYASLQLVMVALTLKYVNLSHQLLSWFSSLNFLLVCVIWLSYMIQRQVVAQPVRMIPHNDIEKWNEKLEELLRPKDCQEEPTSKKKKTTTCLFLNNPRELIPRLMDGL